MSVCDLRADGLALRPGSVMRAVETACGIVSGSETQTAWTVQRARYRIGRVEHLAALTDADIVWLLVMGWEP